MFACLLARFSSISLSSSLLSPRALNRKLAKAASALQCMVSALARDDLVPAIDDREQAGRYA
jgi:hypothetical protein